MITIAHSAVTAKIVGADAATKDLVRQTLSFVVPGAEHTTVFKKTGWDGRSSFFDFRKETFPAGFVFKVYAALLKAGKHVSIRTSGDVPAPTGPLLPIVDDFGTSDPNRRYQYDVADKLVKFKQIIAQVATGGGKSRIARICHRRIGGNTLFITTRSVLLHQMADAVKEMGDPVGYIGDGEWTPVNGFNVAMVQTLAQRVELKADATELDAALRNREAAEDREATEVKTRMTKAGATIKALQEALQALRARQAAARPADKDLIADVQQKVRAHNERRLEVVKFLATVDFLIGEEAHEASGAGYHEVANHCTRAWHRLALTATPFMKDDEEANMQLMAVFGPVAIRVTEDQLIRLGILAKPYFWFVDAPKAPKLFRSTPWPQCYDVGIVNNEGRNGIIVDQSARAAEYGLPVMVLVQRKDHGATLARMMTAIGLKAVFVFGDHKQAERKAALVALGNGKLDVVIGSKIFDVGVDVPAVGLGILAGGGKAEVETRQRIGRTLRKKARGPNVAFIIDFNDHANNHLKEHSVGRYTIISSTPGFREGIVQGFDYESLGLAKLSAVV